MTPSAADIISPSASTSANTNTNTNTNINTEANTSASGNNLSNGPLGVAPDPIRGSKKRRLPGSCDACKKRKCDRANKPDGCTNCIAFNIPCIQSSGPSARKQSITPADAGPTDENVAKLEGRLHMFETLLHKLRPDIDLPPSQSSDEDISAVLSPDPHADGPTLVSSVLDDQAEFFTRSDSKSIRQALVNVANYARTLEERMEGFNQPVAADAFSEQKSRTKVVQMKAPFMFKSMQYSTLLEADLPELGGTQKSGEEEDVNAISSAMSQVTLDPEKTRFFGKSSDIMLVTDTLKLKHAVKPTKHADKYDAFPHKRYIYWDPRPYEAPKQDPPLVFTFPDDDLLYALIDIYFAKVNLLMPLLHKPTFLKDVARGLHRTNEMFGALVLVVCTLGATAGSDDPRVFSEEVKLPLSRGWRWFEQLRKLRRSVMGGHSLFEIQLYCLLSTYMHSNYGGDTVCYLVGCGIRIAQELGIHRRKDNGRPTIQTELWKRAFWVLISIDRISSAFTGRPFAMHDEDFDLDLPISCDDEYWEDATHPFTQPEGKPSHVAYFIHLIKLTTVLGNTCRTIFANKRPKIFLGVREKDWEQRIVMDLDSELNKWHESLPAHLRWDPDRKDLKALDQSASLYAYYYWTRITIHRAFISKEDQPQALLPFIICTNAARTCTQVMDVHRKRGLMALPWIQLPVFVSGLVILLNVWAAQRSGRAVNPSKEMVYVQKCMDVLKLGETRWRISGRFWDILNELSWTGDSDTKEAHPSKAESPAASLKHGRDDSGDEGKSSPSPASPSRQYNYPPPPQVHFSPSALMHPPALASATPSPTFPQAVANMAGSSQSGRLLRTSNGMTAQIPFTAQQHQQQQQQYYSQPEHQQPSYSYGYPMGTQGQAASVMQPVMQQQQQQEVEYMIPQESFQIPDMFGGLGGIQHFDAWQQMAMYGSPQTEPQYQAGGLYQGQPAGTVEEEWWAPYGPENGQPPPTQYRQ